MIHRMARRGRPPKPYKPVAVTLKLHPNVDSLIDDLAGDMERSAYITHLLAQTAGKKVEDLLVPTTNQEVLGKTA